MDMQDRTYHAAAREAMSSVAGSALFAAALMLLFGLWLWDSITTSADAAPTYRVAVAAFQWVLLLGGIAMLISAALCWIGWRNALALDTVLTGLVGLALLIDGLVQAGYELGLGYGFDINSGLMVIFGGLFIASARRSWGYHTRFVVGLNRPMADDTVPPVVAPPARPSAEPTTVERLLDERRAEPVETEKVESTGERLPAADEPAAEAPDDEPEGGFLAELGREDDSERE
jgi:hypothetical protein